MKILKTLKILILLTALSLVFAPAVHAIGFYGATSLTGGGEGALDKIDKDPTAGQILPSDGDLCAVLTDELELSFYKLVGNSGAAESPPNVIKPDDETGPKRWVLMKYIYLGHQGAIRTGKEDADEIRIQAYDVDGAVYSTLMRLVAGNSPSAIIEGMSEVNLEAPNDFKVDGTPLLALGKTVAAAGTNQTFTQADGRVLKVDPEGAAVNLDPSGSFDAWWQVTVINAADAAETIAFDSTGLAQAINQNERGIFVYDGYSWVKIYVGS